MKSPRDERQELVRDWVYRAFGPVLVNPIDPLERARRVLEEALELYQSVGGKQIDISPFAERTFSRPIGLTETEHGQIGVTLLAFSTVGSADMLERMEVRRLLDSPSHYYTNRMAFKILTMPQFYLASEQSSARKWLEVNDPSILKEIYK